MPARSRAGTSTRAWSTTPAVVPRPSSRIGPLRMFTGAAGSIPLPTTANSASVAMATTLFHTGAHAPGANTPL